MVSVFAVVLIYTSVCIFVGWELHGMWLEKNKKDDIS